MSRVLVSFLGTARQEIKENGYRQYSKAKYTFSNGEVFECSFVALALKQHFNIDRLILIGTPKSMWEEVYLTFSKNALDDVYTELGEFCENANHKTLIENFPHKEEVEQALGYGSKIILVKYGLDASEMEENSRKILSLEQYLNPGDELFVDITHSFRSLPLLLMNSLIFLQHICQKNVSIKSISYGMLDITRELGYTKVVELDSILHLNDWISGASEFIGSGNAYKIADLLEANPNSTDADRVSANTLRNFSNVLNFNYIAEIQNQINSIKRLKFNEMSVQGCLLIEPVVRAFLEKFNGCKRLSQYQFCLADYQFKFKHYASAALCLTESIVSFVAECNDLDVNSQEARNDAKNLMKGGVGGQQMLDSFFRNKCDVLLRRGARMFSREDLKLTTSADNAAMLKLSVRKAYNDVLQIRNQVAHSLLGEFSLNEMIVQVRDSLDVVRPIVTQDARK